MRLLVVLALLPVGCSDLSVNRSTEAKNGEFKVVARRKIGDDVSAQVGRFQFHPASEDMPAVLLDTATGCIETFEKVTSVDNPRAVSWWRRYADVGMPRLTYEAGKTTEVPNSAPPSRCGPAQSEVK